jgi:hypothetical protein
MSKTGRRVGGCGRKSMEPNLIWPPTIIELLLGEAEKIVDSMTPTPKIPTDGAN